MEIYQRYLATIDEHRALRGFLTIEELMKLAASGNTVLDPFSTLIGRAVVIGSGNNIYPNTIIECTEMDMVVIGDENTIFPGCLFQAGPGTLRVGNGNQFGDGGAFVKANRPGSEIVIGDNGRYSGGAQILGRTSLGSGSQVLGAITVVDCTLAAGVSFRDEAPEEQGGVLKGFGTARGLAVGRGQVISGHGSFDQTAILEQRAFHPK